MEQTEEAQRAAEELKELIEQGINKNHIRLYYHLMGRIELEKSNYEGAIGSFNKGLSFVSPTSGLRMIYADSMGLAYYKLRNFGKAREEYESIDLFQGRLDYGDIYVKSFYMLGKIDEELGDTAKAIEHYEKFLDLWKDADHGIAEVDDARQRLANLKGA